MKKTVYIGLTSRNGTSCIFVEIEGDTLEETTIVENEVDPLELQLRGFAAAMWPFYAEPHEIELEIVTNDYMLAQLVNQDWVSLWTRNGYKNSKGHSFVDTKLLETLLVDRAHFKSVQANLVKDLWEHNQLGKVVAKSRAELHEHFFNCPV